MNDLKFAFRQFGKNPGFTAVAVLTLALGIGANTAIFSVLNTVLLKPLPYRNADRIMMIWADNPSYNLGFHELPPSQQDVVDWRAQAKSFDQIAAISSATIDLERADESKRIGTVRVTTNLFETLGVRPLLGRTFTAEEEQPGKDKVVILSYALWQREFGADPTILNSSVSLNNEPRTVIGIMPPGFSFPHAIEMPPPYALPARTELWLPASGDARFWADDINRQFIVLGRLKPTVTLSQAQAEMDIMSLVLKQGLRPALLGVIIGMVGAAGLTRFLASQLYGIDPMDPLTLSGVCVALMCIAGAACWLPARRAASIDPLEALRYE